MAHISFLAHGVWLRRGVYGLAASFVVAVLALWLGAPPVLRWAIETVGAREFGRTLRVGDISVNPFTLTARLSDLVVAGAAGESAPLLAVGAVRVNVSLGSIRHRAPVLDRLTIERASAHIVRLEPQRFNFSDIVERLLARPASDGTARFALHNIEIADSTIRFDDRVRAQVNTLTDIRVAIPFVSSLPADAAILVHPYFFARLDGAPIELKGETLPFGASLETAVNVKLEGLHLPKYLSFSPVRLNFRIASGDLDADLRIVFRRAAAATAEQPARPAELLISGPLALRDFSLDAPVGPSAQRLVAWKRLSAAVDEYSVFTRRLRLRELVLDAPEVAVARDAAGRIDWLEFASTPVATGSSAEPPAAAARTPAFDLALAAVRVRDGRLRFVDAAAGGFSKQFDGIALDARDLATLDDKPAALTLSARSADGETFGAEGDVRVVQRTGRLTVDARNVDLRPLAPYLAAFARARFDGRADLDAVVEFDAAQTPPVIRASELGVRARRLRVEGAAELGARLEVASLAVEGGRVDVAGRRVEVRQLTMDAPRAVVTRRADGTIGWAAVTAAGKARAGAAMPAPWRIRVAATGLTRGEMQYIDRGVEPAVAVHITALAATAHNLDTEGSQPAQFDVRARVGKTGSVAAAGNARWNRRAATVRVEARNLDIAALRSYIAARPRAELVSAELSARGTLTVAPAPGGAAMTWDYSGDARLTNVHLLNPGGAGDLLKWKSLALDRIALRIGAAAPQIEVGAVTLSDFFARVVLSEQGRLNLQDIVEHAPAAELAAAPAVAATDSRPLVRIRGIMFERGNVNFTDNYVKPNYAANLTGVGGTVGALASDSATPAALALTAKIDDEAPVDVRGHLNPLAPALYLDITGAAKGIDLPRFTSYAAKYAGYPIIQGRLSVDVSYKVEGGKLEATNRLFLEQLAFGERVASPSATDLPVLFAVALLKNSRGEIDINLPISGSLNDPQFSLGAVIVRVIVNLLVKAATAPFALLAAAFGSGEELGYVEFAPGSAALGVAQIRRLDTLAQALADRPELRLEIIGRVDPARDVEGLRRGKYEAKLRAAMLRDRARAGGAPVDPTGTMVDAAERPSLIARVYAEEKIPDKPRNALGFARTIPAPEMERLILANLAVAPEDLRALANARATAVRQHLETQGKIAAERLFLVDPKLTREGIKDKGATTRVDFSLR